VRAASVLLLALLASCTTPLPVAEFDASRWKFEDYAKREIPFGKVDTFPQVRAAVLAYYNLYSEEASQKRLRAQTTSEISFYSSIVAILGGLAKSREIVEAGGLTAAGAGLYSERYRLTVQAQNYEMAASALMCLYTASTEDIEKKSKVYKLNGTNETAEDAFRKALLESLLGVRERIRRLQENFQLGQPDVNKLKEALGQKSDTVTPDQDPQKKASLAALPNVNDTAALERYLSALKACDAKFGS
jgi:hypothetical protein